LAPAHQEEGSATVCVGGQPVFASNTHSAAIAPSAAIRAEIADAAQFSSLQQEWDDLVLRAAEPNPFLDPVMIAAAVRRADAREAPVVLAWQGDRLVGVWAFVRGRSRSGTPIRVLRAPIHPAMPNGTPVIDSEVAEPALSAMLDAIRSAATLPKILSVTFHNSDSPVLAALDRACLLRGRGPAILRRAARPQLTCQQDATEYFARAISSSRRRKLGQLRRRLATRGRLELKVHRSHAAVAESLERFMRLEALGWKGISGHPLLGTEGEAIARAAIPQLALRGLAEIWELSLAGQAVSMAIILRQGRAAFDWKITYDEKHGDCSPGVLLAQDYTTSFLSDDQTDFADSCAADDTGLLGSLWTGRQGMVDLLLDARGNSAIFFGLTAIETCYANARRLAKRAILLTHHKRGRFGSASRGRSASPEQEGQCPPATR
jgi:CelD/BcsL family acetyltransferase involved in cellulose biosynthesis